MKSSTPDRAASPQPSNEQIAERARRIWQERGSPGGRDLEHWFEAERQLRAELAVHARPPSEASRRAKGLDLDEAEKRLVGLLENPPSPARRPPSGEQR